MDLYYKSLKGAKISTLTEQKLLEPYAKKYLARNFKKWVETVDILNLGKERVNFVVADDIVTKFGEYRDEVGEELSRAFRYDVNLPGEMKNIGSCWDGSKVGKVNEVDSLYVMNRGYFIIRPTKKSYVYDVLIKIGERECKVEPRHFREQFADQYNELISKMELPDCLRHGGYNSVRWPGERSAYSGLRYNGPAATSQFLTDKNTLLTWDVTPCILYTDERFKGELREIIRPILEQNPGKQFPPTPVHLIPDPLEECWRMSTAHFEAELLRYLSDKAPVKEALIICKILCSWLKKWNQEKKEHTPPIKQADEVVEHLMRHLESNMPQNTDLERFMRFAHIWLPCDKRETYNEDEKGIISINTAAVKHIIISEGLKQPGAFAPAQNDDLVLKLVRVVFETLGKEEDFASDHTFLLGTRISHFSVLASHSSNKVDLARGVCEQCRVMLSEAMTEVGIIYVLFGMKTFTN